MRIKKLKLSVILLLGIGLTGLHAQTNFPELVSSSGNHFENSGFQLDWSIGEIAIETYAQGSFTLTQGLHQNTYTVTAIEDSPLFDVNITAYPNPASAFITIENSEDLQKELSIEFSDIQGKVYLKEEFSDAKKQINLDAFSSGVYFLNIKSQGITIKTFKIIKD